MFGQVAPGCCEDARHGRAEMGIEHEPDRDDRQRPADRPARRLEQRDDQDRSHQRRRPATGCRSGRRARRRSTARRGSPRRPRAASAPVGERDAARVGTRSTPGARSCRRFVERRRPGRSARARRPVDAAMRRLAQEPEAGRVVVEHRQREEQAGHEPGRPGRSGRNRISGSNCSSRLRASGSWRDRHLQPWRTARSRRRRASRGDAAGGPGRQRVAVRPSTRPASL